MPLFDQEPRWVTPHRLILPNGHHDGARAGGMAALAHHLDELSLRAYAGRGVLITR